MRLPWGMELEVDPQETVGRAAWLLGVYDLPVTETLWRLTDPGEVAVDAGANVGCMTAALLARTGSAGVVWAVEPHPGTFEQLRRNAARWVGLGELVLDQRALTNREGTLLLEAPPGFDANRGLARVVTRVDDGSGPTVAVESTTLDTLCQERPPDVLKLDVEGHELAALEGAHELLSSGAIRDCVFEDHAGYPSAVSRRLEGHGFSIFRIVRRLLRVELAPAAAVTGAAWEPTSFLATQQPERACARMARVGWRCLGV